MDELLRSYELAVGALPAPQRHLVSERTSSRDMKGHWTLCAADGRVLRQPPPPPTKQRPSAPPAQPGVSAARLQRIDRSLASSHELAMVTTEAVTALAERLVELQQQVDGMQRRVDEERRGIVFRGVWQLVIDYEAGSMVTHGDRTFVAPKSVRSGGQPPARHGSGWVPMFDAREIQE